MSTENQNYLISVNDVVFSTVLLSIQKVKISILTRNLLHKPLSHKFLVQAEEENNKSAFNEIQRATVKVQCANKQKKKQKAQPIYTYKSNKSVQEIKCKNECSKNQVSTQHKTRHNI